MTSSLLRGFYFPDGATAPLALDVNIRLHSSRRWRELLPYLGALDTNYQRRGAGTTPGDRWRDYLLRFPRHALHRAAPIALEPWRGDVLVVGECGRAQERDLMVRLAEATVESGRSVLYLATSPEEHEWMLGAFTKHPAHRVNVALVPAPGALTLPSLLGTPVARQALGDAVDLQRCMTGAGAYVSGEGLEAAWQVAVAKRIASGIVREVGFNVLVTRTTYLPLSAALLAASLPRLTVSMQHSVVTCPASHAPISARRLLCFGSTSRALLERMDADVARRTGRDPICEEVVEGGALVDGIAPPSALRPGAREDGTVLVVDQTSHWVERYLGHGTGQFRALPRAVRELAARSSRVRRIVVRPHPAYDASALWDGVARDAGGRVAISPPGRAVHEDLSASALVLGLFSTVLPVAAASGVPTVFLSRPGWYTTPDLAPFEASAVDPEVDLAGRIDALLADETAYRDWADRGLRAAKRYFLNGRRCDFPAALLNRLYGGGRRDDGDR